MITGHNKLRFENYTAQHAAALHSAFSLLTAEGTMLSTSLSEIQQRTAQYPQGQWLCLESDRIVGACFSKPIKHAELYPYNEAQSHFPDALAIQDMFVLPQYRKRGIGKGLLTHTLQHAFSHNFCALIGILQLPIYAAYEGQMDQTSYVQKIKWAEIYDPNLSFLLGNGAEFVPSIPEFNAQGDRLNAHEFTLSIANPRYNPQRPTLLARPQVQRQLSARRMWEDVA